MRVELLADHPELVPVIARWHFEEWGHLDPQGSLKKWTAGLRKRTNRSRIPMTFVAFEGDKPIGSAVLVEHDMDTHRDFSPWLAGVYVLTGYRFRGVATMLVKAAMAQARELGVKTLYLYTHSAVGFYKKLGWQKLGKERYQGRDVTILYAKLCS